MIGQVQTKDGQKIVVPISGSIPVGNPVGSFMYTYKKIQPRNYLYCDGSTFDQNQYPALYLYLGSNVLPDYRECASVGAEENTTDNIATHDVYAQGEFKDDQIQNITGSVKIRRSVSGYVASAIFDAKDIVSITGNTDSNVYLGQAASSGYSDQLNIDASRVARAGTTTHGKQKAVYVYIKAVDGVDISDEDTFLVTVKNFVEEKNSYSTEETLTGGKWIDGKPIYRKCKTQQTYAGMGANNLFDLGLAGIVDQIVSIRSINKQTNGNMGEAYYISSSDFQNAYYRGDSGQIQFRAGSSYAFGTTTVIVEYTKLTD